MRIKSLEIHGFKSFADRAHLRFGDGITGVVGPNGCGKSNIVDSIRWCMGEMSAKHLRGRAMQDVIFAGSDSRGPMGLAEVTLTFHNDGNVPPQYASYTEIAVSRRLHRDGTSEYLINKTPVRLRDITDLFLGTGVGTRAYSIIEQGRIGFIVNSRPEDRRSLIEEVAGITKFKARKKAADRRLQATEQNLLRVTDIIAELERQLASLRRQAKKAARYKVVKEELRDLDLHAASVDYLRLAAVEKVHRSEAQALETQLTDAQLALGAGESSLEAERQRLAEEEARLRQEQQKSAEVDAKVAALERDLAHWRQQLGETVERVGGATAEVAEAQERIVAIQDERAELKGTAGQCERVVAEDTGRLQVLAESLQALQSALAERDGEIEKWRQDAIEHVHGAAEQRTRLVNLERQRADLQARLDRAGLERQRVAQDSEHATERQQVLAHKCAQTDEELQTWRSSTEEFNEALKEVQSEVAARELELSHVKDELAQRGSRFASLQEIVRRLEGFSDGVRALMGASEQGQAPRWGEGLLQGARALVAEIIEAPPEYERAIEAVLGETIQYLVVDDHDTSERAIEHLRECEGGRSGFIPSAPKQPPKLAVTPSHPGLIGPALGLVQVKPEHQEVARHLLGEVWLAKDLPAAVEIWTQHGRGFTVVTLDGDVMTPGGVLTGGSTEGIGLLATRREIRELAERVEALTEQSKAAQQQLEASEGRRIQIEVDIQQLDKEIRSGELERLELGKDLESVRTDLTRLGERMEVLDCEMETEREDLERIDADGAEARHAAEAAQQGREGVEARIAEMQESRREQADALETRTQELTDLKVQLAADREKLASTVAALERLDQTEAELQGRISRDLSLIEVGTAQRTELAAKQQQGGDEVTRLAELAEAHHRTLAAARARYDAESGSIREAEQGLRERRRSQEQVQKAQSKHKMAEQRLDLERQHLIEQVAERHDVELLKIVGDYHTRPMPGPQEQEQKARLERSLKSIGSINLTAIEECAEVERRHTFLAEQRDDLSAALGALRKAIQRINRASRERFKEAFEAVNEMFQQVFPRLFRGGEASLQLMDADDVLEAGVEIVAQPPGKRLQSVSLLSGGEKALTATALVFAIFLIKPSPFCILDEVDAPLDDANVGRFKDMLREICKFSQFIVITHNKLTMQQADRLYGITMEEPGMSKVVSVDLEQDEEQAA